MLGRSIHQKEKKEKKEFKNKALPSLVSLLLFLIILFCQGPFRFEGLFSLSLRLCAVILFFEFSRKQVSGYDTAYLKVGSFFSPFIITIACLLSVIHLALLFSLFSGKE